MEVKVKVFKNKIFFSLNFLENYVIIDLENDEKTTYD